MKDEPRQGVFAFAGAEMVPQGAASRRGGKRRGRKHSGSRRFLELVESVLRFLTRRDLRRVAPELRVLAVLAKGNAHTLQVADELRTEPRIVKDWLDMAADDGLVLECGWEKAQQGGRSGKAKVWRIAPAGVALLRAALPAWEGHEVDK